MANQIDIEDWETRSLRYFRADDSYHAQSDQADSKSSIDVQQNAKESTAPK